MPCDPISNPAGAFVGFACSRGSGRRRKRCACGQLADRLCDVPRTDLPRGRNGVVKTCDTPVCVGCSVKLDDADVCTLHPVPDEALAGRTGRRAVQTP